MFTIYNGGYNITHPKGFEMNRPNGIPYYLLLIIKSSGLFYINGLSYTVSSDSALIIEPHLPYRYSNPNGEYSDDFLHFSVTNPQAFHQLPLKINVPFKINDSSRFTFYIQQILWEYHYSNQEFCIQNVSHLFQVLTNNLMLSYRNRNNKLQQNPSYHVFLDLRLALQSSPEKNYSVHELSNNLNMSPSHFQHLYTDFFSISFRNDLIKMRIDKAKHILTTTNFTIETIAYQCGYKNDIHFYRQFKKLTGITPSEFRRLFSE